MKPSLVKALFSLRKPLDLLLCVAIIPAAWLMRSYRRFGSERLPATTRRLKAMGVFPISNHYYEPLFDERLLTAPLDEDRALPGIDLDLAGQEALLDSMHCADELLALKLNEPPADPLRFSLNNGSFESGDAEFLYQFLRHTQPRKVIEIGSGNSTKIAQMALQQNRKAAEAAGRATPSTEHICVEPYEQPWLEKLGNIQVLRARVEVCGIDWATALEPGDLLFIDSSHVIRPQGDVLKEYLEILPLLKPGVFVHVHDIFTPKDYPRAWVVDVVRLWNEQYLLEALLGNSARYKVVAAMNHLKHKRFDKLQKVCPYLTADREPGSFYLQIR
ncbi:MAG: class I SAM-dependent methyltransferase [Pseudomonadota bacterium]